MRNEPDYLIRMKQELEELCEKIQKLEAFAYHNSKFLTLPLVEQLHLSMQLGHMRAYASVLHARIIDKRIELGGGCSKFDNDV